MLGLLLSSCAARRLQQVSSSPPPVTSAAFAAELAAVGKAPWTTGNAIRTLENGGVFFPAMLKAVLAAKKTITFESFVNTNSLPVQRFSQAFAERARAGVKVHLILDAFGSRHYGDAYLELMRRAGVQIEIYSPFRLLCAPRYNHRTHRRVLVVDGRVGYTGGAGWTQDWIGHAQAPEYWRDTQYELHGPVVRQLQENFNDNWQELTGRPLAGPDYFPPLAQAGGLTAQMILGSPGKMPETIGSTCLLALRAARRSIFIAHAYFIPIPEIEEALTAATRRGVHVEIMLPGRHTDVPAVRVVALAALRRLIAADVEIYEYQPTMLHGKLMVVDGHLTVAGSGNIDPRSFFLNDENNLHVLSAAFATGQLCMYERDKRHCRRLAATDLRLPWSKLYEAARGRVLKGQL